MCQIIAENNQVPYPIPPPKFLDKINKKRNEKLSASI